MANINDVKRLPFANYDLVVYFGVGVFVLPLAQKYISNPLKLSFPASIAVPTDGFLSEAVGVLVVLFACYALGHVIALLASYLVEGFIHKWLRYPSTVWLRKCNNRKMSISDIMKRNIRETEFNFETFLVSFLHFPLILFYLIIYYRRLFGFYDTKAPCYLRKMAIERMAQCGLNVPLNHGSNWLKIIEHYVANNVGTGYLRLYNYLMIFGLLRSLAFVGIVYSWVAFFRIFGSGVYDRSHVLIGLTWDFSPTEPEIFTYFASAFVTTFLVVGFAKFNRRFFEEALYAFVLSNRSSEASAAAPAR